MAPDGLVRLTVVDDNVSISNWSWLDEVDRIGAEVGIREKLRAVPNSRVLRTTPKSRWSLDGVVRMLGTVTHYVIDLLRDDW